MLSSRRLIVITALLWAVLLAHPIGRANFLLQALHPGPRFPAAPWEDADDDTGTDSPGMVESFFGIPEPLPTILAYPDDRDVQFGLVQFDCLDQNFAMKSLIAKWPRDPALLAIGLSQDLSTLQMGRDDNSLQNPSWPQSDSNAMLLEPASPPASWSRVLALANRGRTLEPDNTYFDWARITALFALHRDADALATIDSASHKTGYDDHARDQAFAALRGLEKERLLTPAEQRHLSVAVAPPDNGRILLTADCAAGRIEELQAHGDNPRALAAAYHLLLLGKLISEHAYFDTREGMDIEVAASSIAPRTVTRTSTSQTHGLISQDDLLNLAQFASLEKQPAIAREVLAEHGVLSRWAHLNYMLEPSPDEAWWCLAASVQERWGRILLRTLPVPLALFLLASGVTRFRPLRGEAATASPWFAILGGAGLLILFAAGDTSLVLHQQGETFGSRSLPNMSMAPGLYALGPLLVCGTTAVALLILSLNAARRGPRQNSRTSWAAQIRDAHAATHGLWELDLKPLVRFVARITIATALLAAFADLCGNRAVNISTSEQWLFLHNGLVTAGVWTILIYLAARTCFTAPERRKSLRAIWPNLRRLTGAYLLAALLVYALTGLAMIPVVQHFDRLHRQNLYMGPVGIIRRDFGF